MNILLWVLQILAALVYGALGVMKVFMFDKVSEGVHSFGALPRQAWMSLGILDWTDSDGKPSGGTTVWCVTSEESKHFAPSNSPFMLNYRVEDLHALVAVLKEEGCNVIGDISDFEYGKFAHVLDPEGNKVELWQPPAGQ